MWPRNELTGHRAARHRGQSGRVGKWLRLRSCDWPEPSGRPPVTSHPPRHCRVLIGTTEERESVKEQRGWTTMNLKEKNPGHEELYVVFIFQLRSDAFSVTSFFWPEGKWPALGKIMKKIGSLAQLFLQCNWMSMATHWVGTFNALHINGVIPLFTKRSSWWRTKWLPEVCLPLS